MPSAAKNSKAFEEKNRKNLAVLTITPRLKRFPSRRAFKAAMLKQWG